MQLTATLTPKFQIHIPVTIRINAGFTYHGPVAIRDDGDRIIIEHKKHDILSLAGKYKEKAKRSKIDLANIRDHIDYGNL